MNGRNGMYPNYNYRFYTMREMRENQRKVERRRVLAEKGKMLFNIAMSDTRTGTKLEPNIYCVTTKLDNDCKRIFNHILCFQKLNEARN